MSKYPKLLFLIFGLLLACKKPANTNQVQIRISQDPENLSTVNYNNAAALQILNLLFQSLMMADLADGQVKPALATGKPIITKEGNKVKLTFQIREEAVWSDQKPVTGADVALTLKVLNCPLVQNERQKLAFEFITDIQLSASDAKEFTLITDELTPENEFLAGDFFILPAHLVDPKNILKQFSLSDIQKKAEHISNNPKIQEFAQWFNSDQFTRNKAFLKGSGGYEIEEWQTGQFVRLRKKSNWWGEKINQNHQHITAQPERIIFQVVPDNGTAILALRNQQLDVFSGIPVNAFQQLQADQNFKQSYNLFTPATYEFTYLGINSRLPKFADAATRQALAHLLDVKKIIQATQKGYAIQTVGPVIPTDKQFYNSQIQPYAYSLQEVMRLLQVAGWVKLPDRWQKNINGKAEVLTINLNYKAGNTEFENIALIFQQEAAKINIPITIQPLEGLLLTKNLKDHSFEVFIRYLSGNPFVYNFKPIFHTQSAAEGGGNYTGFGTPESDRLIGEINDAQDNQTKVNALKRLQEILHEQSALIFLYFNTDRLAIHKRFTNLKVSAIKPGYDVSSFTLKED